jgi:hypothetical protein
MAAPAETLLDALQPHQDSLKSVGLTLNRSKSEFFIPDGMRTTNLLQRCQQHNIEEGSIKLSTTTSARGILAYGIPLGQPSFVAKALDDIATRLETKGDTIRHHLDPHRHPQPHIPCRQAGLLILQKCLQHQGNYWTRHIHPKQTESFAKKIDQRTVDIFSLATTIDIASESSLVQERIQLPTKSKGVGIRRLEKQRYSDFMGGSCKQSLFSPTQNRVKAASAKAGYSSTQLRTSLVRTLSIKGKKTL